MPIDSKSKREALNKIQELKKNPPRVTQKHRDQADDFLKKSEAFEAQKDKDILNERKALAKDVAGYVYNQYQGVGKLFHGFGEGKATSLVCRFPACGKHFGTMHNMNDNQWYCSEHKFFGNLSEEQKKREMPCLS